MREMIRLILKENSFQFSGKLYLPQTHRTAMGTKTAVSPANIDLFGQLNFVPDSNPLGTKRFVSGISISFNRECHIVMQIQYTKNLNPGRFELGTTLSYPNRSIFMSYIETDKV